MNNKNAIAFSFGRAAKYYDDFAILQRKIGTRLFRKCSDSFEQKIILDAGCGTGFFSKKWKLIGKRVIALDISQEMLKVAKVGNSASCYMQADIESIPLKSNSVDLCFSNLVLQWCRNIHIPLSQMYRVTKYGGLVVFTTLADGSLKELRQCWEKVNNLSHFNSFLTYEEVEIACKIWLNKLEQISWYFLYPSFQSLLNSIKGIGASYLYKRKKKGLMTQKYLEKLVRNYPNVDNMFPLTYKIIFGTLYRE
ncbi:malonyl-ACP O-methyltransferase BioC [Candidatus Riesia pediculischaeffi]|nr:malonyl-ACP O-methyltransferase BioC [Candidatus Riesia pediculischaeffi]KIE64259.1 Biotin synthesis protein bioC [Candidatus Riesia pediculischaeffi PTSU]